MIQKLLTKLWSKEDFDPELKHFGVQRSKDWPLVRKEHLLKEPACTICGCMDNLSVHHIIPVHIDKSRELDEDNLITLCEKYNHHFLFGHCQDWKAYNPNVRDWVTKIELMKSQRRYGV